MRATVLMVVPVLALLSAGCDKLPKMGKASPTEPVAAAAPAPSATPAAAPAPVEAQGEPAAAAPAAPTPAAAQVPPPPAKLEAIRFSRADYGARERRLAALIGNAETRDTSGETQYRAQRGEAERQRCTTKACIERSYAAEEAWMRRWEGS